MRAEGSLGDVVGMHPHLMIPGAQIELGEEASAMELVKQLIHHRNRELVLESLGVEGAVVDAEAPRLVRLPYQQDGRGERRGARPDDALGEHGRTLSFQLVLLQLGVAVRAHRDRGGVGQQVDAIVIRARRWEPRGLIEDGAMLLLQQVQQRLLGVGRECSQVLLWDSRIGATHALPKDASAPVPEGQRHGLKVPQDGTQGP
jgi:hypothetical protein